MTEDNKRNITLLINSIAGQPCEVSDELMRYIFANEVQSIRNKTNTKVAPSELIYIAEERTAGELLNQIKGNILGDEEARVPKSIKQGDVAFEFAGETKSERLSNAISQLLRSRESEILCYRVIRW